jgi:hypothetical protein
MNWDLITEEFMIMKDKIASSRMSEWNGKFLVILGQIGFIRQLQEEMKDMKEMYGDNRIIVANQLNDIGGRFNQLVFREGW